MRRWRVHSRCVQCLVVAAAHVKQSQVRRWRVHSRCVQCLVVAAAHIKQIQVRRWRVQSRCVQCFVVAAAHVNQHSSEEMQSTKLMRSAFGTSEFQCLDHASVSFPCCLLVYTWCNSNSYKHKCYIIWFYKSVRSCKVNFDTLVFCTGS